MVSSNNSSTGKKKVCPVTGLPIVQKPEWTDIDCGESYSVTFQLIGKRIVLNIPKGNSGNNGIKRLFEEREKVLKDANLLGEKFVELKDYSGLAGAPSREGRQQFMDFMIKERDLGNLIGYWGFNCSWFVKLSFNVGLKLIRTTYPVVCVKSYKEAVTCAVKMLKENHLIDTTTMVQQIIRDDWQLNLDGFSVQFKIIGGDIVYTEAAGILKEHHVNHYFELHKKVLEDIRLPEGKFYRIANWSGITKSTWKARILYIEGIKKVQKEYSCVYSVIYGLNKIMSVIVNLSRQFIPFDVVTARSLEEALDIIERKKQNKLPVGKPDLKEQKTSDGQIQEHVSKLLYILGIINWEHEGIGDIIDEIDQNHPLKSVYDSISLVKHDFDTILKEKNEAVKVLQENEERFRIMFESSHDLVTIIDADKKILWANASWQEKLGYLPKELHETFEKVHPDDQNRLQTSWELMKQDKGDITNLEYRYRTSEGGYLYLETSVRKLHTSSEKLYFVISHDITERVTAEEENLMLEEKLRQSEKMRAIGQLAGGIAHDFNNQLAGIIGYADIMRRRIVADKHLYAYVDKIQNVVNRASGLTAQLLAFARKGKYQIVPLNIHDLIAEVISLLEHTIDKRITIKKHLHADVPITIGDPTQLQNVFLNITINARDAMPEGGEITFTTEMVTIENRKNIQGTQEIAPGRYVQVLIADTGIGINEEIQKHIFEPFFTTKKEGKGTGMGLAAVYGTIRNHNGAIDVSSEVNKGTTFTLYLPVNESKENIITESSTSIHKADSSAHIFFIEDEEMVVEIMEDMLTDMGYMVTSSRDGNEAVACFKKIYKDIDLVILDMMMPGLNGKEIFKEMRKIKPDVKVIISSGYSLDSEAQKMLDEGALTFIQKPYRIDTLLQIISEAFKS